MNILGINLNRVSKEEVSSLIEEYLNGESGITIVTPNPEIILRAQKSEELYHAISDANLRIMDGMGLKIAGWFMGENFARITGADLTREILKIGLKRSESVDIVISDSGLSGDKDIKESCSALYPGLCVNVFTIKKEEIGEFEYERLDSRILINTMGSPFQEVFNNKAVKESKYVRVAIAAGGSIDYITQKAKRAPMLVQFLGFEWLWRAFFHLNRFGRIFNAVVVFPYKFAVWRFILPWLYRPNVACLLLRLRDGEIEVMLTERRGEDETWQLPQGGTDGEDLMKAGARELEEEIGTGKFTGLYFFKNVHKYKFGSSNSPRNTKYGYKGQRQGLFIARFEGVESDIMICPFEHQAYKWVKLDNIVDEVEEVRKESAKKFLDIFNSSGIILK